MNLLKITLLFIVIGFMSCADNTKEIEEGTIIELSLEDNQDKAKFYSLFGNDFKIERMYKHAKDKEEYIYAQGENSEGISIEARYSRLNGFGESCSGVGCSKCRILAGGGCTCDTKATPNGYCNHTVTEESDE